MIVRTAEVRRSVVGGSGIVDTRVRLMDNFGFSWFNPKESPNQLGRVEDVLSGRSIINEGAERILAELRQLLNDPE